jgi:hypothetical protein
MIVPRNFLKMCSKTFDISRLDFKTKQSIEVKLRTIYNMSVRLFRIHLLRWTVIMHYLCI